jgi:hypothetical protein
MPDPGSTTRALVAAVNEAPPVSDTSWPPVLVYFAVFLFVVALGAAFTIFRRARATGRRR